MKKRKKEKNHPLVALVDDDIEIRELLTAFLEENETRTLSFESAEEFFEHFSAYSRNGEKPDLVLSDVLLPGDDGNEFTRKLKRLFSSDIPVIMMSASEEVEHAISALRTGACDYFRKPFDLHRLLSSLRQHTKIASLKDENVKLKRKLKTRDHAHFVGKSVPIKKILESVEQINSVATNVLIRGESGTGKEVLARLIHKSGDRESSPFIAVNCSAIPENLLESELFGYVKGAFTGAEHNKSGLFLEASDGTLFLDEIGDMSTHLQAKLLRVLQEKEIKPIGSNKTIRISARIIAATHQNLKERIRNGRFREDLFYRLNVVSFHIPPLRERRGDILPLAMSFLERFKREYKLSHVLGISHETISILEALPWYGNVRELENTIERSIIFCKGSHINPDDLPELDLSEGEEDALKDITQGLPSLKEVEKRYIQLVLKRTLGVKNEAARILGLSQRTLYRKIESDQISS